MTDLTSIYAPFTDILMTILGLMTEFTSGICSLDGFAWSIPAIVASLWNFTISLVDAPRLSILRMHDRRSTASLNKHAICCGNTMQTRDKNLKCYVRV